MSSANAEPKCMQVPLIESDDAELQALGACITVLNARWGDEVRPLSEAERCRIVAYLSRRYIESL